jgi:hypothetical protein
MREFLMAEMGDNDAGDLAESFKVWVAHRPSFDLGQDEGTLRPNLWKSNRANRCEDSKFPSRSSFCATAIETRSRPPMPDGHGAEKVL